MVKKKIDKFIKIYEFSFLIEIILMDATILQKVQKMLETLIIENALSVNNSNSAAIDLSFVAPDSDFVNELGNKPVINCYLIGVNEDKTSRRGEPFSTKLNAAKTVRTMQREPKFIDISYMLTVWCKDKRGSAEIEHLLIGYLICGLGKFEFIPPDVILKHGIDIGGFGLRCSLFGTENSSKDSSQVWQAMGSTPKPSIMLSLTVPINVHEPQQLPAVQEMDRLLDRKDKDKLPSDEYEPRA